MIDKIKIFITLPLRKKIRKIFKLVNAPVYKIMYYVLGSLAKLFINTKIGRKALYEKTPENQLLLTKTSENLYYIVNSSDKVIGKSIYSEKKSFDAQHLSNAMNLIPYRKSILLDVGANIGTIGILGVSKGYFNKCIAFEPEPNNFEILKYNVSLNGLDDKFELRNEALSDEDNSTLEFELSKDNYGDHRIRVQTTSGRYGEGDRKVISVAVNTLDAVLSNKNLGECVLFMDAQGFEGHVLSGAKKLIKNNIPIITEFWPYGLIRSDGLKRFYDVLSSSAYTSMWDLRNPSKKLKFSINELKKIASELGENGHTDLVFINEQIDSQK